MPVIPAATTAFLTRGVTVLSPELTALRGLKPPADAANAYGTALGEFDAKLGALNHAIYGLGHGGDPVNAIRGLQHQLGHIEAREDGAWRALQIPACVNR